MKTYSFTNAFNYTTTIKVVEITEKSVWFHSLLNDGTWSTGKPSRISPNSFKDFKEVKN